MVWRTARNGYVRKPKTVEISLQGPCLLWLAVPFCWNTKVVFSFFLLLRFCMNRFCLFLSDFVATSKSECCHEKSVFLITSEIKSTKIMNMKTIIETIGQIPFSSGKASLTFTREWIIFPLSWNPMGLTKGNLPLKTIILILMCPFHEQSLLVQELCLLPWMRTWE